MARHKLFTALLAAAGVAAVGMVLRRRSAGPRSRIELYFEDGSLTKLESGEPGTDRLFALAREALTAARPVL